VSVSRYFPVLRIFPAAESGAIRTYTTNILVMQEEKGYNSKKEGNLFP
jgi:hypothetical protein